MYCKAEEWCDAHVDLGVETGWGAPLDLWQSAAEGTPLEAAVGVGGGVCGGLGIPLEVVGSLAEEWQGVSTVRKIPEGT